MHYAAQYACALNEKASCACELKIWLFDLHHHRGRFTPCFKSLTTYYTMYICISACFSINSHSLSQLCTHLTYCYVMSQNKIICMPLLFVRLVFVSFFAIWLLVLCVVVFLSLSFIKCMYCRTVCLVNLINSTRSTQNVISSFVLIIMINWIRSILHTNEIVIWKVAIQKLRNLNKMTLNIIK